MNQDVRDDRNREEYFKNNIYKYKKDLSLSAFVAQKNRRKITAFHLGKKNPVSSEMSPIQRHTHKQKTFGASATYLAFCYEVGYDGHVLEQHC